MTPDFVNFPELTGSDLELYYFMSPHKQIFEDFSAEVVKVHDGDTVTLRWSERDFDFPLRFLNIAAPELKEKGGLASRDWLAGQIFGKTIEIKIDKDNRVGKFGRLLGKVELGGIDVGQNSVMLGHSLPWDLRSDGKIQEDIGNLEAAFKRVWS